MVINLSFVVEITNTTSALRPIFVFGNVVSLLRIMKFILRTKRG